MGCFQSKKEISDQHPNIFRVINVDENGADLCSGQLEITDLELILYREGRDSIVWPLHSLRRFGYDSDLFSFESGRRCETGEGIYAFKCRRASLLFRVLHQRIYQRNRELEAIPRLSPSPTRRRSSVVHRSSVDNGHQDNLGSHGITQQAAQTSRSPSREDILEVTPLYPRPQPCSSQVTNIYQVKGFKREHNNNQAATATDGRHMYCNELNRDLAILRSNLKREAAINTMRDIEEETRFLASRCLVETTVVKPISTTISPSISTTSDHYAQLNIEQQDSRLYVNITPNENVLCEGKQFDTAPATPLTPKQSEYRNLTIGMKPEINAYANLMLGELSENIITSKQGLSSSEHHQKFSESDTFTSISPVEELEVNYAVLDIDSNTDVIKINKDIASPDCQSISSKNGSLGSSLSETHHVFVSQDSYDIDSASMLANSPQLGNIGYTSIDFAATSALSSVVTNTEIFHCEANRKNRHNSCTVSCGSPGSLDKSKGNT